MLPAYVAPIYRTIIVHAGIPFRHAILPTCVSDKET